MLAGLNLSSATKAEASEGSRAFKALLFSLRVDLRAYHAASSCSSGIAILCFLLKSQIPARSETAHAVSLPVWKSLQIERQFCLF